MGKQLKNQCSLNKNRKETQSFFMLWKSLIVLKKELDKYMVDSEKGKQLKEDLIKIGRKEIKSRGKLFVIKEKDAKTISDLLFYQDKTFVYMPFYLVILLQKTLKNHNNELQYLFNYLDDVVGKAYKVAQENNLIIRIVYGKLLMKFHNIYQIKDDLYIEGFLGLMHAVYSYSPVKKVKFETYAYYWCWKYMFNYAREYLFKEASSFQYNDNIKRRE